MSQQFVVTTKKIINHDAHLPQEFVKHLALAVLGLEAVEFARFGVVYEVFRRNATLQERIVSHSSIIWLQTTVDNRRGASEERTNAVWKYII